MSQTVSVGDIPVGGYQVSVTTRHNGEPQDMMEELTYRTIKAWVVIVTKFLEQQVYTLPLAEDGNLRGSVEQAYAAEINAGYDTDAPPKEPFAFAETFGDARVTCWDTFKSNPRISFHLNSDDIPQVAVDTWLANQRGIQRAFEEFGGIKERVQNTAKTHVDAPNSSAAPPQASDAPATTKASNPAPAVEGAIVATRAPKSSEVQYSDGQLVSFTVTKIVASSNKGSPVYEMWTPLGSQWPTIKVYKLDTKGKEKPDYKTIVGILATLNLSLDKPEAMGTWRLIVKAAHVPGTEGDREFLNVVSLTAI